MTELIVACAGLVVFCILLAIILATTLVNKNRKIAELEAVVYEAEDKLDALNTELDIRNKATELSADKLVDIAHNGVSAAIDILRK